MTTLVLENGRVVSISASTAATLNQARQREGQPTIPTVSQSEAQTLARRLAFGSAGDLNGNSDDEHPS